MGFLNHQQYDDSMVDVFTQELICSQRLWVPGVPGGPGALQNPFDSGLLRQISTKQLASAVAIYFIFLVESQ